MHTDGPAAAFLANGLEVDERIRLTWTPLSAMEGLAVEWEHLAYSLFTNSRCFSRSLFISHSPLRINKNTLVTAGYKKKKRKNSLKRIRNFYRTHSNSNRTHLNECRTHLKWLQNSFKQMRTYSMGCKPVWVVLLDVDWDAVDEGVGTVLAHKLQCLLVLQQVAVVALQNLFPATQPYVFFKNLNCRFFHDLNGKPLLRLGNPLLTLKAQVIKFLEAHWLKCKTEVSSLVYTVVYSVADLRVYHGVAFSGSVTPFWYQSRSGIQIRIRVLPWDKVKVVIDKF